MPLLAGNAIQAAYTMVNRMWVGQYLGSASLAAVTVAMQVTFILIAAVNGLTIGSGILISQFVGARNWDGVKRVVQNSVTLMGIISVVLLVVGQLAAVPLLRAIHTPPESWSLAVGYMRLFVFSFPLIFVAFLTAAVLRGVGDSVTPLVFQAVGVAITAVLDPLLMLGWLGFPKLGLNGTVVAMLIAQSTTTVAFFVYLHRKKHPVAPNWRQLRIDWPISKMTFKIGIPVAVQQLLVSLGSAGVLVFINEYKDNATAGFGAASQIDMIAFFVAMSFSMAISTIAGQNIGAGRFDRVRQTFWCGLALSGSLVLVVSILAVAFPTGLMSIFIPQSTNPEAFRIGVSYLRVVGPSYITFAVMFVSIGIINGAGHTMVTTAMTLIGLWCVRLPLAAYFSHRFHRVEGIWYALVISFTVTMILSLVYFFSGKWKHAVLKHGPIPPIAAEVAAAEDEAMGIIP
jgi:putative MATE family efflux protein